jgi:uncharacterized Zn-finger protein
MSNNSNNNNNSPALGVGFKPSSRAQPHHNVSAYNSDSSTKSSDSVQASVSAPVGTQNNMSNSQPLSLSAIHQTRLGINTSSALNNPPERTAINSPAGFASPRKNNHNHNSDRNSPTVIKPIPRSASPASPFHNSVNNSGNNTLSPALNSPKLSSLASSTMSPAPVSPLLALSQGNSNNLNNIQPITANLASVLNGSNNPGTLSPSVTMTEAELMRAQKSAFDLGQIDLLRKLNNVAAVNNAALLNSPTSLMSLNPIVSAAANSLNSQNTLSPVLHNSAVVPQLPPQQQQPQLSELRNHQNVLQAATNHLLLQQNIHNFPPIAQLNPQQPQSNSLNLSILDQYQSRLNNNNNTTNNNSANAFSPKPITANLPTLANINNITNNNNTNNNNTPQVSFSNAGISSNPNGQSSYGSAGYSNAQLLEVYLRGHPMLASFSVQQQQELIESLLSQQSPQQQSHYKYGAVPNNTNSNVFPLNNMFQPSGGSLSSLPQLLHSFNSNNNNNSNSIMNGVPANVSAVTNRSSAIHSSSAAPSISHSMRKSRVIREYNCDHPGCVEILRTRFSLKRHMKKHSGEKPFECYVPKCGKKFPEASTLKRHIRIHTGEKPFTCKVPGCGKQFADATNVKRHEMTHSGTKAFLCILTDCTRSFSRGSSLKNHMISLHKVPPNDPQLSQAVRRGQQNKIKQIKHGANLPILASMSANNNNNNNNKVSSDIPVLENNLSDSAAELNNSTAAAAVTSTSDNSNSALISPNLHQNNTALIKEEQMEEFEDSMASSEEEMNTSDEEALEAEMQEAESNTADQQQQQQQEQQQQDQQQLQQYTGNKTKADSEDAEHSAKRLKAAENNNTNTSSNAENEL